MKTFSSKETLLWAKKFAKTLSGGQIIALSGDLGTGKTLISQGILRSLGVKDSISSPTYTVMRHYKIHAKGMNQAIHVDAYRLENEKALETLGLDEWLDENTILIIEWADKIKAYLKGKKVIWIHIADGKNRNERVITVGSKVIEQ